MATGKNDEYRRTFDEIKIFTKASLVVSLYVGDLCIYIYVVVYPPSIENWHITEKIDTFCVRAREQSARAS